MRVLRWWLSFENAINIEYTFFSFIFKQIPLVVELAFVCDNPNKEPNKWLNRNKTREENDWKKKKKKKLLPVTPKMATPINHLVLSISIDGVMDTFLSATVVDKGLAVVCTSITRVWMLPLVMNGCFSGTPYKTLYMPKTATTESKSTSHYCVVVVAPWHLG